MRAQSRRPTGVAVAERRELQILDLAQVFEHRDRVVDGGTAGRATTLAGLCIDLLGAEMLGDVGQDELAVAPPAGYHGSLASTAKAVRFPTLLASSGLRLPPDLVGE